MRRLMRLLIYLALLALILGGLYLTAGLFFTDLLVDLWWFRALGYEAYFWQRLTYRQVVFGAITGLFFLVFFLNFWVASRFLSAAPPPAAGPEAEKQRLRDLLLGAGAQGCYVFSPTPGLRTAATTRFFNPVAGIPEDPATGSAAGPDRKSVV